MTQQLPLYARVAGDAWTQVAEPIRRAHAACPLLRARGRLRIECGRRPLERFLVWLLRLPRTCAAVETRLDVTATGDEETWRRTFEGNRGFDSRQYVAQPSVLAERFRVLEFRFRLHAAGGSLVYEQREAAFLFGPVRVRIPAMLAPRVEAREDGVGPGQINVNVRVALPGVGRVIAYDGIMVYEDAHA